MFRNLKRGYCFISLRIFCIWILFSMVACKSSKEPKPVGPLGFLENYSQLQKEKKKKGSLSYTDAMTNFSTYKKVVISPIGIYASEDSNIKNLPKDEIQSLVNYLHSAIENSMSPIYSIGDESGPDVLRLRVALVEDEKDANTALETRSRPTGKNIAYSSIKRVSMKTHSVLGFARIEAEILDSESGKRLLAFVEPQPGAKDHKEGEIWKKWKDTTAGYDAWAEQLIARLKELRKNIPAI